MLPADAQYMENIRRSGRTIYDPINRGDEALWVPTPTLERLLGHGLKGFSVRGLPLRTRSKVVKERVCIALGYPTPASFRKTQPRFPGQDFDTYIQKSNNLQIWNEELSPTRRYALIQVGDDDTIERVKVVTGDTLAFLDTTGTLTQKYQASASFKGGSELCTAMDTENLGHLVSPTKPGEILDASPVDAPRAGGILPIAEVFHRVSTLVGTRVPVVGKDQERSRGAFLHQRICQTLGFSEYREDGQFPDIRNQLVEVKLQTSPTIDLGLVRPDSEAELDLPTIGGISIRHRDVRYVVFGGMPSGHEIVLNSVVVSTGERFLQRFPIFGGRVLNKKLQIPLPENFFLV
jgi:hypothetical protein